MCLLSTPNPRTFTPFALAQSTNHAVENDLEALPRPFVDRSAVEFLLSVGRRRAQQILAPCITDHVGSNGLASREVVIAHLRRLAGGDAGFYERH